MKIEIEFDCSYQAAITIDGRKLKLNMKPKEGCWKMENLQAKEEIGTIGGIVAMKLMSPLIDILQGCMPDNCQPNGDCWETWQKLSESAADEVYDAIN